MGEARRAQLTKGMAEPPPEPPQGLGAFSELAKKLTAKPAHEPILKSLEKIGIRPIIRTMPDGVNCFIIPVDTLVSKEYQYMTGLDVTKFVPTTTSPFAEPESKDSDEQ